VQLCFHICFQLPLCTGALSDALDAVKWAAGKEGQALNIKVSERKGHSRDRLLLRSQLHSAHRSNCATPAVAAAAVHIASMTSAEFITASNAYRSSVNLPLMMHRTII
jgi:hypothetical protein